MDSITLLSGVVRNRKVAGNNIIKRVANTESEER